MIFRAAKHRSDDHLLSKTEDSQFAADMISAWARRCLGEPVKAERAQAKWMSAQALMVTLPRIFWLASIICVQMPLSVPGGLNTGPAPYDFLLAGLGACTAMTLTMYARRKGWPLEDVDVQLSHAKIHQQDTLAADGSDDQTDHGPLDDAQRGQLMQIADKCPVHC